MPELGVYHLGKVIHESSGFRVLEARRLSLGKEEPPLVLVGEIPGNPGDWIQALVKEERHPRYGPRLRVLQAEPINIPPPQREEPGSLEEALYVIANEFGHTAPPLHRVAQFLRVSEPKLLSEVKRGSHPSPIVAKGGRIGLVRYFEMERYLLYWATRGRKGLRLTPPANHGLTQEQAGIFDLLQNGVGILTGGPGTGKSHTVAAMLRSPSLKGKSIALTAPTGKAARRMKELSGLPAQTVHRLLGVRADGTFTYNSINPLPYDLVVVDEAGMMDLPTFYALAQAIKPGGALLLVGDKNQLPPVGPGHPFRDLLELIPTLELTRIQRQVGDSPIVQAAHAILEGLPIHPSPPDLVVEEVRSPEEATRRALEAYLKEENAILLSPTNVGPSGTYALNAEAQKLLNPKGPGLPIGGGLLAREEDPVVSTWNNYALGIANGELFKVKRVDLEERALGLVGDTAIQVPEENLKDLLLAYALSVHRSQGSEWPTVIIVIGSGGRILSRELFYTALTRGKRRVYVIHTPQAMEHARGKVGSRRFTWIPYLR